MKTVLVVAGNKNQFDCGIRDRVVNMYLTDVVKVNWTTTEALIGDTRYIYISRPEMMRGFRGVDVEFWGTWFTRSKKELDEFEEFACFARSK